MLVWYLATAVVGVWAVFDSPAIDYRFVLFGAALPIAEIGLGRPGPLHSLPVAVGLLAVVMAVTTGRRLLRRRLLGIPIGLMAHLVFSGIWADTDAFWWPLSGGGLSTARPPELARGPISIVLEVAGIALGWWWLHRVGLVDSDSRDEFRRTGRIPRATPPPVQGTC